MATRTKENWEEFKEVSKDKGAYETVCHFLNFLKMEEKDKRLETSGSIQGNNYELDYAGISYLYKKNGQTSTVFEIRMKDNIRSSDLQRALDESLKRYPYFQTRLLERDGNFYIVHNDLPLQVKDTTKLRALGSHSVNRHLLDVSFHKNNMYLAFHHALCDGGGFKPFVETLVYYYCSYRYNTKEIIPGVRLSTDALLPNETDDPFDHTYDVDPNYQSPATEKDGCHLPECDSPNSETNYRYSVQIKDEDYMSFIKANKSTPSIMTAILISQAIQACNPENTKAIICNNACDMRKLLHCENTFKNCVTSFPFVYYPAEEKSLMELSQDLRSQMNLYRNEERAKKSANMVYGLAHKVEEMKTFKEKKESLSFFDTLTSDTFSISYIGKMNFGYNDVHIDSVHLFNEVNSGLGIHIIDAGGEFSIDFKQSFSSDQYVQEFANQLKKYNVPCTVTSLIEYTTPTDQIQQIARVQ